MSDGRPNVGVIFKSYEPLRAIQNYARQTEESGYPGGFWIAEAYHWFRKYGHESRGCFTTLAAATMSTSRIPIGLGITSPYMRHPTIQASECNAIDELSGGRFIMGLGAGKVGTEYLDLDMQKFTPVKTHKESIDMIRGIASGEKFAYEGELFRCDMPAIDRAGRGLRTDIPVYIGATGPYMQKLAGKMADGLLLPGLTSPGFTRYAHENCRAGAKSVNRTLPPNFPV
ncbi:MAG TPA: LLM class flavin-dependent oxidoreductase, partial [Woeseiaceae bacterium]|nr:LLM class flavin-dependent oxidoreductase [Woeseiaceae bacterium]